MSDATITATVSAGTRQLGTTEVEIFEVIWSDGGRSFDVVDTLNGRDLTENGSFDRLPADDEIRALLHCTHSHQRVDDRSQFHCTDCGEWLGR